MDLGHAYPPTFCHPTATQDGFGLDTEHLRLDLAAAAAASTESTETSVTRTTTAFEAPGLAPCTCEVTYRTAKPSASPAGGIQNTAHQPQQTASKGIAAAAHFTWDHKNAPEAQSST